MAVMLTIAIPLAAVGLGVMARAWAQDAIHRSPTTGRIGVACTAAAAANLWVARSCGDAVNRPIVSVAIGTGDCYRTGVVAVGLVLLLGVATSALVRAGDVRP